MIVPYTTERRADTGVNNVTLGMWLFIASEVMLFGALFSSYALLRASATDWPSGREVLSLPSGLTNTALLLLATGTIVYARRAGGKVARALLIMSTSLALSFLAWKFREYDHHLNAGLFPRTNTFLAMYFTLTAIHAAHVIAGMVANMWVMRSIGRVTDAMANGRLWSLTLYWAFVDIVWLIIFVLMYLS